MSIDYASLDDLDAATATAYVRDAIEAGTGALAPQASADAAWPDR
jgi:hypothetical protein